jgi:hypothetical protein
MSYACAGNVFSRKFPVTTRYSPSFNLPRQIPLGVEAVATTINLSCALTFIPYRSCTQATALFI